MGKFIAAINSLALGPIKVPFQTVSTFVNGNIIFDCSLFKTEVIRGKRGLR